MARAKYTVDPEALSLVGPNSFADAFSSALRGARLGDSMATSALNRELGRERNRRIEDDRKIAAAMSVSPGGVSVAPTVSSGKGKSSAGSVSFSPISMSDWQRQAVGAAKAAEIPDLKLRPMFDGDPDIIWGTPKTSRLNVLANAPEGSPAMSDEERTLYEAGLGLTGGAGLSANEYFRQQPTSESRISQKAMERVQSGELTPNQAERFTQDALAMERMSPTRGFVDVPMQNPAERVGYRSDYLQTPQEFQSFLLTRRGDLSRAELEKTQQDYENYYAQRTGMYRDDMSLMRRAAQIASEREAQEAALAAEAAADQKRNEALPAYRAVLKPIQEKFNYSDEDRDNIAFAAYENGITILALSKFVNKSFMDSLKEEGLDLRSKRTTGVDAERNRLSRQKYEDTKANREAAAQSVFGEVYEDSKNNLGLSEAESIQRAALAFRAVDANKEGDISKVIPRFGEAGGAEIEEVSEADIRSVLEDPDSRLNDSDKEALLNSLGKPEQMKMVMQMIRLKRRSPSSSDEPWNRQTRAPKKGSGDEFVGDDMGAFPLNAE